MTPSDVANMSDDECLVAAMLLGMEWRPWHRDDNLKGGTFNTNMVQLRGHRYAHNKYYAARLFLNERATPSNPRR